mgnify:CR=1 FL=1|tara:strand:- start:244 stop:468 length:225 start_codon:yes stop_codon:yes gene_type:complete
MQRIIYKNDEGGVSVIVPAPNILAEGATIDGVAKRAVPTGKKYKIVDTSTISSDRTFRNAWEVDESLLTDGVGE